LLAEHVDPASARVLHARLAECCDRPELPPIYRAYHFVKTNLFAQAVAPMDAMSSFVEADPNADVVRNPITLETLEIFSELRDVEGAHPAAQSNYAAALVMNAIYRGLPERAASKIAFALAEISRFTGVTDYLALDQLPDGDRLTQALTRANERCQQPGVGGMDLIRLIRRQTQLCITSAVCAEFMADPTLLAGMPDLLPFAPLAPALGIAVQVIGGLEKLAQGQTGSLGMRWWPRRRSSRDLPPHRSIRRPWSRSRRPVSDFFARSNPSTGARIFRHTRNALPRSCRTMRKARSLASYLFADAPAARAARKRSELLSVHMHSMLETKNTEAAAYATLYALSDDLIGLRQVQDTLIEMARTRPGWRPRADLLSCHVLRCQGRIAPARALIAATLAVLDHAHVDFAAFRAQGGAVRRALRDPREPFARGAPCHADAGCCALGNAGERRVGECPDVE
jgi:hypothetical protein